MANINFKLGFDLDKGGITQARKELSDLMKVIEKDPNFKLDKDLQKAHKSAEGLLKAIEKAYNPQLKTTSIDKMQTELLKTGKTLGTVEKNFERVGVKGAEAFNNIQYQIDQAGIGVKKTNKLVDDMFKTLANTAKWNIASSAINQITGSIQRAVGFTKALDNSLNQIRIVSGKSAEEMKEFAKEANESARALGQTTTAYTDASLLYFQQGKSAAEVRELTDATLMAANVTGGDVAEMADMITSALNGYSFAADEAIRVTDVLSAVGAATGSDFEELAIGMSKVASQAATVNVPFEQLNAMLATISETTREAPETIGTSLKTVFARMSEIKLTGSATDEDGVEMSLGRVQDALSLIDVSLKDSENNMKGMGEVITEIGNKWAGLNVETKSAITNALAGQRQASRLMALFNQWDRYEVALNEAMNATGATLEQNQVRMDSYQYQANQLTASLEEMWMKLINEDVLKGGLSILNSIIDKVNSFLDVLGGMGPMLTLIGGAFTLVFQKQIGKAFSNFGHNLKVMQRDASTAFQKMMGSKRSTGEKSYAQGVGMGEGDEESKGQLVDIQHNLNALRDKEFKLSKYMTEEEQKQFKELVNKRDAESQILLAKQKEVELKRKEAQYNATLSTGKLDAASLTKQELKDKSAIMSKDLEKLRTQQQAIAGLNNQRMSEEKIKAALGDQAGVLDVIDKKKAGYNQKTLEVKKVEEQINQLIKERERDLRKINNLQDLDLEAAEAELEAANVANTEAQREEDIELDRITKSAERQRMIQGAVAGISAAAVATTGLVTSFRAYNEAAGDVEKQNDAIVSGATTIGSALMMLPGPWGKVAGAMVMAAGAAVKWIRENTGIGEVVMNNKKSLEEYRLKMEELNATQKDLNETTSKMDQIESLKEGGLIDAELEEYRNLVDEIATSTPQVVDYYDAYGKAVLKTRAEIDKMNESLTEQIRVENERMAGKGASFATEMAYLTTTGVAEKEKLQAEIDKTTAEIEEMYAEGKSMKSIGKKESELNDLYSQMSDIEKRFQEMGKTAQEGVLKPFIGANDVFKELGPELQEFTTALANTEAFQEGIDEISKMGTKNSAVLKEAAEDYIDTFTSGILEVANAFKIITESEDKAMIDLEAKLKKLPEETKKGIGEIALEMTPFMDEQQLSESVDKMASFIDEKGKIDAFGMMDYFRQVGEEAKVSIEQGVTEAAENLKTVLNDTFGKGVFGGEGKTAITQLQEEMQFAQNVTVDEKAQIMEALNEYKNGNTEILETLYTTDMEIKAKIDAQVEDLVTSIGENERLAGKALRGALDEFVASKEAQEAVNESFGETNILVDNYAAKMAQTAEGQQYIVDMWNQMVSITEEVGEEGLFSVDLISMEEQAELMEGQIENADELAAALDEAGLSSETLSEHAKNIGMAFQDVLNNSELRDKFQNLTGMSDDAMQNIQDLANEAKKGTVGAAKQLQSEMGKIYATLYAQDGDYFKHFVKTNRDRLNDVALVTGLEAGEYKNLADYQGDLAAWVTMVGGQEHAEQLIDLQGYLGEQVAKAKEAAGTSAENQAAASDAANRASAIMALATAGRMAESARQAGASAADAGEVFLNTLQQADTGAQTALEGLKGKLDAKGEKFASIKEFIDAAIAELSQGGEVKLDLSGLKDYESKPINYTPPGGSITAPSAPPPPSQKPPSTGGPDLGGDKGGSGGGGGADKEKEVEDLEWEEDIYHDINIQLEKKQQLLDDLQKQQDKLYGKELLDNLAQQKKTLEEQQKLYEEKLKLQKQDAKNQAEALKKQGVEFNVDGTIANYNKLLKEKLAYVNSLSGEAKEAAKEEFAALEEAMQEYEDLVVNGLNETEDAITDIKDQIHEIFLQEFDYKITIQLELTGDFDEALQWQKDFNDEFEDSSENYQRTMDQLGNKVAEMQAIQAEIAKVEQAYANGELTDKEYIERMEEYSQLLKESTMDAKKLSEELTKLYKDTLKEGMDMIKEQQDAYKDLNDEIKHMQQMMKLLGQSQDFGALNDMFEAQYQNIQGQIGLLSATKESLEARKKELEDAGLTGTEEWKALNEEIGNTQKELDKLAQDAIKVLQDKFMNSVDAMMSKLDDVLSGGLGLDKLKEDLDYLKKQRKEFLDTEEKITEIGKLQAKLNAQMANTTDPKQLAALQKFKDEELAALKEKDKLTEYDIDRANLMYELTLKQMALDEQKNAKNMMKLVRDASGNWVYEFVEDTEAVAKAQEELSDVLEKIQEADKKEFERVQEEMLKSKMQYEKDIQDVIKKNMNGEYEDEAAFRAALAEVTDRFNEDMLTKSEQLQQAQSNGIKSSLATTLQAYREAGEGLGMLAGEQEETMLALAEAVGDDFTKLNDLMSALDEGNEEDFNAMAEQMGLDADLLRETLTSASGIIAEEWGGDLTDMIGDITGLGETTDEIVNQIMANWEQYEKDVAETQEATGNTLEDLANRTENIKDKTEELNEESKELVTQFDAEMEQMSKVVAANDELRQSYEDVTKEIGNEIAKIDELIRKQKELLTGVDKPGPTTGGTGTGGSTGGTGGSTGSSGGSTGSSGGATTTQKKPAKGKQVKVKNADAGAWYDSSNNRPVPKWSAQANAVGIAWNAPMWSVNAANGKMALSKTNNVNGALAWVKESDLVGLRTGGYTGAFNNPQEGKLAVLHEKELVLNKEDTANMLKAVNAVRGNGDLGAMIRISVLQAADRVVGAISTLGSRMSASKKEIGALKPLDNTQELKQTVSINADFGGVRDAKEIEKAFDNLAIQASQYAMKKR